MTEADQNLNVDTQESFKRYRDRKRVFYDGELIDKRYQVISTGKGAKASGGMGQVYRVKDTEYGHIRAIKLLDAEVQTFEQYEQSVRRFKTETDKIKNNSEIDSEKSIVKVYETCPRPNDKDGNIYFIMDWHEQGNLKSYIEEQRAGQKVSSAEACQMLKHLARALSVLHKHDIIHRDLKPENIMISVIDGEILPVIIDFGIARDLTSDNNLTKDHRMLGTNLWKAPEQFGHMERGGEAVHKGDEKTDIFSFGMLGFYLATGGEHPFFTKDELVGEDGLPLSDYVIGKRLLDKEAPPRMKVLRKSKLPGWYVDLIERCISRDRDIRPESFLDVLQFIENEKIPFSFKSIKGKVVRGMASVLLGLLSVYASVPLTGLPGSGLMGASADYAVLDLLFGLRGEVPAPPEVVGVTFDDLSRNIIHRIDDRVSDTTAWPRTYYAQAIREIAKDGPRKVILDVNFHQERKPLEEDRELVEALKESSVYIARAPTIENGIVVKKEPHEKFVKNAAGVFTANLISGHGVIRAFTFTPLYDERIFVPSVATVLSGDERSGLAMPSLNDFINFYGPADHLKSVPLFSLLSRGGSGAGLLGDAIASEVGDAENMTISKGIFKDKYVFIYEKTHLGYSGKSRDVFPTAYREKLTPGGEIQATIFSNVVNQEWIKKFTIRNQVLVIMFLSIYVSYIALQLRPLAAVAFYCAATAGWLIVAMVAFSGNRFMPGAFALFVVFCAMLLRNVFSSALNRLSFGGR